MWQSGTRTRGWVLISARTRKCHIQCGQHMPIPQLHTIPFVHVCVRQYCVKHVFVLQWNLFEKNNLRNFVQITPVGNKIPSNSIMCNNPINYSLSVSTEMLVLGIEVLWLHPSWGRPGSNVFASPCETGKMRFDQKPLEGLAVLFKFFLMRYTTINHLR